MTHSSGIPRTNFGHLEPHDTQLVRLGMLAERYFPEDPNTSLLKLRQLAELLAQLTATRIGLYTSSGEPQYDLLRRLQEQSILPREIAQLFGEVRRAGNAASHALTGDHRTALAILKITWQLGIWFHRTFATLSEAHALMTGLECNLNLKRQLEQLPKRQRISTTADFRGLQPTVREAWATIQMRCSQAERFTAEVAAVCRSRTQELERVITLKP